MNTSSTISERTLSADIEGIQDIKAKDEDIPINTVIQTVVVITICSIGLGANSCALLVLLKSSIIKTTTGIYLTFLSVYDNLVLVAHLLYVFSEIFQKSNFACKLMSMTLVSVQMISCHILVTMTIEKCYVLVNPYKSKPTQKQAFTTAAASVIIITLVLSTQMGVISGVTTLPLDRTFSNSTFYDPIDNNFSAITNQKTVCKILPQYEDYGQKVLHPILVLHSRLLSPAIVIICNLIIIIYLKKHATQVAPLNATANATANNDKRITILLIVVSLCFAILILPSGIYMLLIPFLYDDYSEAFAPDNPAYHTILDCTLLNHSINYFLYILASKTFRKEAKVVFKSILNVIVRNNQN